MVYKKIMSAILAGTLVLSLVGCGSSSGGTSSSDSSSGGSSSSSSTAAVDFSHLKEDGIYACSDVPLTLTAHVSCFNNILNDDMDIPVEESLYTNITLKGVASTLDTDDQQSFNLMIAGSSLPDIAGGELVDINKYGMEGAFIPLNDLIDEFAPDIRALLDEYPEIESAITAEDGNIYQIPFVYDSVISTVWFIRQDWLDLVGKDMPNTVDEFYDVLCAFRDTDLNGNGAADEIPLFMRTSSADHTLIPLLGLFGVNDQWHTTADGTVQIGTYTEGYKEAIKSVSQWYAEKLLDPEIFTRSSSRDVMWPENNGGVTNDWLASTSNYNGTISDIFPDFELVGMLPPVDSNGDQWVVNSRAQLTGRGWGITIENDYPEETMKMMNWRFTEKGREVTTYGIEGDTYEMVDGVPMYKEEFMSGDASVNVSIFRRGGMIEDMAFLHDPRYEYQLMPEQGIATSELYMNSGMLNSMYVNLPALNLTQDETSLISAKWPTCRAYILEMMQTWVFDGSRIDAEFDTYMDTLGSMGMDDIVVAYQAAYDRVYK